MVFKKAGKNNEPAYDKTMKNGDKNFTLIDNDIGEAEWLHFVKKGVVAVDSETTGLDIKANRLCLVQLSAGDGKACLVKFTQPYYQAHRLKKLLTDDKVQKIFHFARFDLAVFYFYLGVLVNNIYCTKIASKILRPDAKKHSLSNLAKDLLGVVLDKQQQLSDWGAKELSAAQLHYAANDVLYLHQIKEKLDNMASDKQRAMVMACHQFLPTLAMLDMEISGNQDIFAHH
ncbi:MAG: ribonuclease D [Alphaproteobacteria bacterium]